MPFVAGLGPYRIDYDKPETYSMIYNRKKPFSSWYLDGLTWFSFLVPWRTFHH